MHSKTLEQLRADLAQQERMAQRADIPESERAIYAETATYIRAAIAERERQRPAMGERPAGGANAQPAPQTPAPQNAPQAPQRPAAPVTPPSAPMRPQAAESPAQAATVRNKASERDAVLIDVVPMAPGATAEVLIRWTPGEEPEAYTVGVMATRFRQYFAAMMRRDHVKDGLWHLVPTYWSFHVMAVFYRALSTVWRRDWQPADFDIDLGTRPDSARVKVWNLIIEHSKKVTL